MATHTGAKTSPPGFSWIFSHFALTHGDVCQIALPARSLLRPCLFVLTVDACANGRVTFVENLLVASVKDHPVLLPLINRSVLQHNEEGSWVVNDHNNVTECNKRHIERRNAC